MTKTCAENSKLDGISLFAKNAHELGGGVWKARAAPRNEIHMTRHVELPHFYFFHPAVLEFPLHAHARDNGHTHAHLHKALDALNRGHLDGHIEGRTVARK